MNVKNRKWLILISTGIMIMLVNLDMTIVNLALAKISSFFNASINQAQWIIGSYLLATALSFIIFGCLADQFGRKKIFIIGVFLFVFSSFIAGVTNNLDILIFARFIQGLGFAATLGLSIVFIVNAFPENQKGFATGMAIMITGLAQVAGPTLGGIILQYWNWHGIFLINVPLGIISFFMTILVVPTDVKNHSKLLPFTITNTLLFVGGLSMVLFSLNEVVILDWKITFPILIMGLILLAAFINNCKKEGKSLINKELLNNTGYLNVILLRFIFMIMMSSVLFIIPLYLQNIINLSPFATGLAMLFMTIFVAITSPLTGKLIDKIDYSYFIMISFACAIISALLMTLLHANTSLLLPSLSLIFFGLAVGIHTPSSISGALTQVSKDKSGTAIGVFFTAAITGATVGVALTGALINIVSSHFIHLSIPYSDKNLSPNMYSTLLKAANGTVNVNHIGLTTKQLLEYQPKVYYAFIQAFHYNAALLLVLMLIAFALSLKQKTTVAIKQLPEEQITTWKK